MKNLTDDVILLPMFMSNNDSVYSNKKIIIDKYNVNPTG